MIGQTLVLVCAAFGLAAASCMSGPAQLSSNVVLPEFFSGCNSVVSSPVLSGSVVSSPVLSGSVVSSPVVSGSVVSSPVVSGSLVSSPVLSNGFSGSVVSVGSSLGGLVDGNLNGPETPPLPPVQAPSVTLPTVESPMVTLSAPAIPAPRVLASRCVCTKTVVKPQVYQRVVTVPKVQRYFKRTVTPVVENLVYKSKPLTTGNTVSSGAAFVGANAGTSSVLVSGTTSPVYVSGSAHGRVC